ncbi:MAG: hypothetical protein JSS69_01435 [Acidobacteria bacterium]|nr:hypothetical protein [Acidobacteriota bacterium]MBS1864556.1 hypothetical protein [Acidobacteriota bacterium]
MSSELEANLRELASAGPVELRENGARVAPLSALSWEVRGHGERPLLHLWSSNHNLTRRVLAITDQSDERLALAVERFGRARPDRLEFVRVAAERSARDQGREEFCRWIEALCASQFPDATADPFTIHQDLEHSLSGNYARGVLTSGKTQWAVIAAPEAEGGSSASRCLTFGLLWLERLHSMRGRGPVSGLRFLLPRDAVPAMAHLLAVLNPKLQAEIYRYDRAREIFEAIDPSSLANISSTLVPLRESQSLLDRAGNELESVVSLAPSRITLHPSVPQRHIILRFRGLSFARWEDEKIFFGLPEAREQLHAGNRLALKQLLQELETHRHPLASDGMHPQFRAQPERWLETLVREDVTRIDIALDPRFAYAQVLANAGGDHGILDILAVTRTGRLAILELKCTEFLNLPLQAADYWLRIKRHLDHGNIARYGYFPGVELQSAPPIVYLVAPALRFHPAIDAILRSLSPQLEIVRVGLAENWRRGIRVVLRQ